jgi:transcriptional regulator with XRE-family HTH domain
MDGWVAMRTTSPYGGCRMANDVSLEGRISLEELRKLRGLTQLQVAKCLGRSQQRVAFLERGDSSPSVRTLRGYVAALGGELLVAAVFDGEPSWFYLDVE